MKPMLAKQIDVDSELIQFCNDPRYAASQKVDGIRILMDCSSAQVQALSRRGIPTCKDVSAEVRSQFASADLRGCIFDGEYVEGVYHIFDLPSAPGSYAERRAKLQAIFASHRFAACVKLLPSYTSSADKLRLAMRLLECGAEGVMFNLVSAPYQPGKRSRDVLKAKFIKDVDCVVVAKDVDGKSNMHLAVYDGPNLRVVGSCTALAGDGAQVKEGDVVTVQYLYAVDPENPRIYQPTLPRIRHDKATRECVVSQIRFCNRAVL